MHLLLQILALLFVPYLTIKAHQKYKWLSPIFVCYALGIVVGNVWPEQISDNLMKNVYQVSVILAIPMLLFSSDVKAWLKSGARHLLSFGLAILATSLACIIAFFIWHDEVSNANEISAMLLGVYSGGTPNMSAIQIALGAPEEQFLLLNSYDILLSVSYFAFIISIGQRALNKLLPKSQQDISEIVKQKEAENEFLHAPLKGKVMSASKTIVLSILILGIGFGVSSIIWGTLNDLFIILWVSIVGILASLIKPIREIKGSYETADYFLLIFGLSMGSQANFGELINQSGVILQFCVTVFSIMLVLHLIFSKLFKIDTDLHFVSSAAAVFGPPFIGPVVSGLENRSLLLPGITMGVIGNVVGTWIGIALGLLLAG